MWRFDCLCSHSVWIRWWRDKSKIFLCICSFWSIIIVLFKKKLHNALTVIEIYMENFENTTELHWPALIACIPSLLSHIMIICNCSAVCLFIIGSVIYKNKQWHTIFLSLSCRHTLHSGSAKEWNRVFTFWLSILQNKPWLQLNPAWLETTEKDNSTMFSVIK